MLETQENGNDLPFFHHFLAGGIAGSASIIVGHPFDTIKVRLQTSPVGSNASISSMSSSFGGISSLFRGMAAPLSFAAAVNAIVFSSYNASAIWYDKCFPPAKKNNIDYYKAFTCGAFAGLAQSFVICPVEHVKCRIQVQHGAGAVDNIYKGPVHAAGSILRSHGLTGLFRGWWATTWREIPGTGVYFVVYFWTKDVVLKLLSRDNTNREYHTWLAAAIGGGVAGCVSWASIYPFDVIKSRIQTLPLETPAHKRTILYMGRSLAAKHGVSYLFRGLGIAVVRAFPVDGIIFPVYELTLQQIRKVEQYRYYTHGVHNRNEC